MNKNPLCMLVLLFNLFFLGTANGQIITLDFEDMIGQGNFANLPTNYSGLSWGSDWTSYSVNGGTFVRSSGLVGAFTHVYGQWVRFNQNVTFLGSWNSASTVQQNIWWEGYKNGVKLYESPHVIGNTNAHTNTWIKVYWTGIDEIKYYATERQYSIIDDIRYAIGSPPNIPIIVPPTSVIFGNVLIGEYSDQTFNVRNDGVVDLTINSISISAMPFSTVIENCSNTIIAPSNTCSITIRFSSTNEVTSSESLNIFSTDPIHSQLAVPLIGTGFIADHDGDGILDDGDISGTIGDNPCSGGNTVNCDDNCVETPNSDQSDSNGDGVGDVCGIASISVSPLAVDFGNANIGSNSNRTIIVTNDGTGDLNIGTISNPSLPFIKTLDNCNNQTLIPYASCTITIQFSPVVIDSFNSTFAIQSDDPSGTSIAVTLNGRGVVSGTADIDMSSGNVVFLNIPLATITEQTLTVTNIGGDDLNITNISSPVAPFSVVSGGSTCYNAVLMPNQSCTIVVRFVSTTSGVFSSSFDVSSNDLDENSVSIGLFGSATVVSNNPPDKPSLVYPPNGSTNLPLTFDLGWSKSIDPDGENVSYSIYYGTDPSFTGNLASLDNQSTKFASMNFGIGLMSFGFIAMGAYKGRKKISMWVLILLTSGVLLIACGSGGGGGGGTPPSTPVIDFTYTLTGLDSYTTYYWVVFANDGIGGTTASDIFSFTTGQ